MSGQLDRTLAEVQVLLALFGPLRRRHCPLTPTPRQHAFMLLPDPEAFFGGAAGGGKSVAVLMAALQYTDVPGYHALLLRPSLTELQLPGGLIDLSHDWLADTKAVWSSDAKIWRFPGPGKRAGTGGASLGFGYLSDAGDIGRYAGSSYSFLGFDELTRFSELLYRRMFRVVRQPTNHEHTPASRDGTRLSDVPVRIRSASNPGGPGHSWVKTRFVDPLTRHPDVVFLPSRLTDNPHLDHDVYAATLAALPTAERERLLHGDWEIPDDGELFQRSWFEIIEPHQLPDHTRAVRYWDLAGTAPGAANPDPDYTVGVRLDLHPKTGIFYIIDIVRERLASGSVEQLVAQTAKNDGQQVAVIIEQEPGASGKAVIDRFKRHVLRGYNVRSVRPTGPKEIRARPVAAAAENGLVKVVRGRHTHDFLDELTAFPHARHDDCVDALAGAHQANSANGTPARVYVARGLIHTPTPGGDNYDTHRYVMNSRQL